MKSKDAAESAAERWLTYRPEIRVVDCTIRDGGLVNNHNFNDTVVKAVYEACSDAGVDYMEAGYKSSRKIFSGGEHGKWKFCSEDDLKRLFADRRRAGGAKISVMADADRTDYREDIPAKKNSVIDLVRIATYIHQIPVALDMLKHAHDQGYETALNLMSISTVQERDLDGALALLARSEARTLYVVDSFGSLYSEQVRTLVEKFRAAAPKKTIGIHTHNNQQLAYANTIEAIIAGANMLDASFAGLGRGAGNCPTELLLGFLHNPKFRVRPVLRCIQDHIEPLRASMRWGYETPYMITGLLNQHPRTAIAFCESDQRGDICKFFDATVSEK